MQPSLYVVKNASQDDFNSSNWLRIPTHIALGNNPLLVGSDATSDLWLDHISVSDRHCIIAKKGDTYWLDDLISNLGTSVNGKPVIRKQLANGDIIQMGIFRFRVDANHRQGTQEPSHKLTMLIDKDTWVKKRKARKSSDLFRRIGFTARHSSPAQSPPLKVSDGYQAGANHSKSSLKPATFTRSNGHHSKPLTSPAHLTPDLKKANRNIIHHKANKNRCEQPSQTVPSISNKATASLSHVIANPSVRLLAIGTLLAAAIAPHFGQLGGDDKTSTLSSFISVLQQAINAYDTDHRAFPGVNASYNKLCPAEGVAATGLAGTAQAFVEQLTMYTNEQGQACMVASKEFKYGPYLNISFANSL